MFLLSLGRTLLMLCFSSCECSKNNHNIHLLDNLFYWPPSLLSWPVCLECSNNVMVTKWPLGQQGKHELTSHLLKVFMLAPRWATLLMADRSWSLHRWQSIGLTWTLRISNVLIGYTRPYTTFSFSGAKVPKEEHSFTSFYFQNKAQWTSLVSASCW